MKEVKKIVSNNSKEAKKILLKTGLYTSDGNLKKNYR